MCNRPTAAAQGVPPNSFAIMQYLLHSERSLARLMGLPDLTPGQRNLIGLLFDLTRDAINDQSYLTITD